MGGTITNTYGKIIIGSEVIAKIAGLTAMECYGVVGMAAKNVKDGLVQLLGIESLTKGIKIYIEEDKISIDFHIIVEYGTNITAIGESLINTVKYRVEQLTGIQVDKINIFVEGIRVD